MNNKRWKELVEFAKNSMYYFNDGDNVSDDEVQIILSVLKDNIPFFDATDKTKKYSYEYRGTEEVGSGMFFMKELNEE